MLYVKGFECNALRENCYVVSDDSGECVIIDCGAFTPLERQKVVDYIRENGLKPQHLIATHGHIDHNIGNDTVFSEFGLRPEVHQEDKYLMDRLGEQSVAIAGMELEKELPAVGKWLSQDDVITFGTHTLTIIHTPGHSRGSVFYYCKEENTAFSGDTLFNGGIGRTDFWGGSMFQMIQSLRTISQLPDDTVIYPGHGPETTMGAELATNPYLDR